MATCMNVCYHAGENIYSQMFFTSMNMLMSKQGKTKLDINMLKV